MNSKLRSIAALVLACVIQLSGTGNLWAQDNDYWVKIAFLGYYKDYHFSILSAVASGLSGFENYQKSGG